MRQRSLLAALALSLVGVLVAPTAASAGPFDTGSANPVLSVTFADSALRLTTAGGVIEVSDSGLFSGDVVASAVPAEGTIPSPVSLALEAVSGPGEIAFQVGTAAPLTSAGDTATVGSDGETPVSVSFSAPGHYTLTVAGSVTADTAATTEAPASSTVITATPATLEFEVAEPPAGPEPGASDEPVASDGDESQSDNATQNASAEASASAAAQDGFVAATADSAASTADGRTIFSQGLVGITPLITDESHVELGLVDQTVSTRDATKQTFYTPDQVVLHLPNQDVSYPGGEDTASEIYQSYTKVYDPAQRYWSTPAAAGVDADGNVDNSTIADRLLISLYAGANYHKSLGSGFNADHRNDINGSLSYSMTSVDGPGDFAAYQQPSAVWPLEEGKDPLWTSTDSSRTAEISKSSSTGENIGTTFTHTGVYCLTLGVTIPFSSGVNTTDNATYTVVVGALPATVPECAQPAEGGTPADDRTVFSQGLAGITPLITDESHVELGLVDQTTSTRDATKQTFYSPDQVILQIPEQDSEYPGGTDPASEIYASYTKVYDPTQHYWSTPAAAGVDADGNVDNSTIADRLLISLYAGANYHKSLGSGFNAGFRNDINGAFSYSMVSVSGPGGVSGPGDFSAYQQPSAVWPLAEGKDPLWTSTDSSRTAEISKSSSTGENIGTTFTQTGVYCLTLGVTIPFSSGVNTTDNATYTVVVGALPATVPECAQPGDGGGTGEEPEETPVIQIDKGHTDVRAGIRNNELYLGFDSSLIPFERVVLSGTQQRTVPGDVAGVDTEFLGDEGQPYWYFPEANVDDDGQTNDHTWPGFSTESIDASQVLSPITFTLTGVSGPGDVALWSGLNNYDPMFSTRLGLPMSAEFATNSHAHRTWSFTQQGVYCLALTARAQLADGHWSSTSGQLTVVAGDEIDPATVTPCERTGTPAPLQETHTAPHDLMDGVAVYQDGYARADVFFGPHGLDVASAHRSSMAGATEYRDLDDAILSTTMSSGESWTITGARTGTNPEFSVTTTSLNPAALAPPGVTRITLGEVEGPGEVAIGLVQKAELGSAADSPTELLVAQQGTTTQPWRWSLSAPGIYCVPLTFTVPLGEGFDSSVTKTLTVVAGTEEQFPREQIVPCADGGQATPPVDDGGEEEPQQPVWDVPNGSLTDSGARILNDGHIDIASLLDGNTLVTQVKDTTESATPIWRATDATVMQLLPDAQNTVPDADAYRFLGEPGARFWQVTETQQSGLLWPGWSTESIPVEATQGGVEWSLKAATGPGEFALYTSNPTQLGAVDVRFNTRDGITVADSFLIPKNTHAHGSWAFSAEGVYCLAFTRSTTLPGGAGVADDFTLAVAVGETNVTGIDPGACFTEPEGQPSDDDSAPIALTDLTDGNAGGVQVLGGDNGFTAGQLVTVQVDAARAGQWVSAWLDDTSWLGWVQVGSSGAIQVRLPADAAVRSHVLVVKDRDGGLIGWDSLSVVASETPGGGDDGPGGGDDDPAPEPDAVWDVANGTVNESGAAVLNNGHVDIASLVDGGALPTRVKDTTQSSDPTFRDPARTVLQLLPNARTVVPSGSQWSFLGRAGASFYQVSQTQQAGLLWPGWSTESIPLSATQGGVDWKLTDISGPGEFALYETGSFGEPSVLFSTRDGITGTDRFTIPKNTHAHGSWAFSAQGNYCLAFERSATLASGAGASDRFVLAVAVGYADVMRVDPAACFQAPDDRPASTDRDPIADGDLTDAAKGDVTVLDKAAGFAPGQLVSIQVGDEHAGEWVSVWLHSDPIWLGWAKVDTAGTVQVRLPANAPLGSHKLVVKAQEGTLLGWDSITLVKATTPEGPGGDTPPNADTPPAVQVPSTQCVAGATILSSGHIDYASRLVGGQLESLIGDDTSAAKVYREPSGTILWLKPSSRVTLPNGYGQVGAAGSSVWQVPQTQNPDLIWLGWSTEALNAGNTRGPVTWTINSIDGPGALRVYLSGSFGGVQSMVFDNGGSYSIPLGVHAHANWAFSAEGVYRISTTQTATLANGQVSSDTETLTIVVGNVDPASAAGSGSGCGTISNALLLSDDQDGARLSADQAAAAAAAAARDQMPGQGTPVAGGGITDPFTALAAGNPVPLLLSILGALLLVGAAGTGVLWWRRRPGTKGSVPA